MHCWGKPKCLRDQSVGVVSVYLLSQVCNFQDESQPGLQLVEKLATPLSDIIIGHGY